MQCTVPPSHCWWLSVVVVQFLKTWGSQQKTEVETQTDAVNRNFEEAEPCVPGEIALNLKTNEDGDPMIQVRKKDFSSFFSC